MKDKRRLSGILLHPTSFPSPYGIGDLGPGAYDFIDFLAASGQHLWQVLPLGPTGFGDSPYQGFSAFAGQPLLISPSGLKRLGLVGDKDLEGCPASDDERVDYGTLIPWKQHILEAAYREFCRDDYDNQKLKEGFSRNKAAGLMTMLCSWHARNETKGAAGWNGKINTAIPQKT